MIRVLIQGDPLGYEVLIQKNTNICRHLSTPSSKICRHLSKPSSKIDRKSTRLNSSHSQISYAVFCLKKKKNSQLTTRLSAAPRTSPPICHQSRAIERLRPHNGYPHEPSRTHPTSLSRDPHITTTIP